MTDTTANSTTRRRVITTACAAIGAVLLQPRESGAIQIESDDVEQMMQRFLVPFSNRDVVAFSPFFTEDATVFFPGRPPTRVQGRVEITRSFTELFGPPVASQQSGNAIQPQDLLVQRFDTFAVVTFHLGTEKARGRRTFPPEPIMSETTSWSRLR